ncbi:MAG: light-regulated signal transduction histidine kinase (bacteriophytochrome) [Maribacter sp.]
MRPIKALEYHHDALEISERIKNKKSTCHALFGISKALISKDKARYPFSTLSTKEWIENKLAEIKYLIGNDDNLILNKPVLETHANFYKYLGDFKKAFYYLEKLMSYNEEYLEKEKIDSVKVLQIEYDLQKKELEKINKSLEKKITERTKDLMSKNKELQEYAYIVAHDLKEPIRSIVSFSQLLERKIKGKLNAEELELLNFIKHSGTNMGNLVQSLLQYTTVNINYKNIPKNDINEILQETLTSINFSIEQNNATINIDWLPKKVKCDKIKISQLFQNIISNAIKFKKKDQVIEININCKEQKDNYLFSISDNGIGIEKDYHKKIFKLFKRLNKNQNYEGTGIGLSLSKKIVEQHGGEIWLESEFDKGTTFYFTLPRN